MHLKLKTVNSLSCQVLIIALCALSIDACKPQQYYNFLESTDGLVITEESLNFYSSNYSIVLDKAKAYKLISKVESMINSDTATKIQSVNELPDTLFEIAQTIQLNYLRRYYGAESEDFIQQLIKHIALYQKDLADTDQAYNSSCSVDSELPNRRLLYAIKDGSQGYLLAYDHGRGIGGTETHLTYVDLMNEYNTITWRPEYIKYSDHFKPLGYRHISYFKGEVYDSNEEDIF